MKSWQLLWLLATLAQAKPLHFSDGHCSVVFPGAYQSQGAKVWAHLQGQSYTLTNEPLKGLDPAQRLAELRRQQLAQHAQVRLVKIGGRDGLEVRASQWLARVAVNERTVYQVRASYSQKQSDADARRFVNSFHFLSSLATPYTSQRMSRYDSLVKNVPVQKCAEQLLEISSLLAGFRIKNKRFPSELSSLQNPVTQGYGYRRQEPHYLLYCQSHQHPGLPPRYPRSDDRLRTLLGPNKVYTPGY